MRRFLIIFSLILAFVNINFTNASITSSQKSTENTIKLKSATSSLYISECQTIKSGESTFCGFNLISVNIPFRTISSLTKSDFVRNYNRLQYNIYLWRKQTTSIHFSKLWIKGFYLFELRKLLI